MTPLKTLRMMTTAQRAQRRHDLLLAAATLRRQVGADLARLEPAADRLSNWVDAALWLRRHWSIASRGQRQLAFVLAVAGGVAAATGLGGFALRHWRWWRNGLIAWRLWRQPRA